MLNQKTKKKQLPKNIYRNNDIIYLYYRVFSIILKYYRRFINIIQYHTYSISTNKIYKLYFIIPIFLLLFTFAINQSNVSRNLILNAYFNNSDIVHVSYDGLIQNKKQEDVSNIVKNLGVEYDIDNLDKKIYQKYYNIIPNSNKKEINISNICKKEKEEDIDEMYLLDFFPLKKISITFVSSLSLYVIIKICYAAKINNSLIINGIAIYITYHLVSSLYNNKYYLASGIILILLFFFIKCSLDCIYLIMRFKRNDFEVFSINLSASNFRQFILKFIIICFGTILSYFFSKYIFQLCFNYIIFYICLFALISFLSNSIEINLSSDSHCVKNLIIFISGLVNFILNKIYRNKYYCVNTIIKKESLKSIFSYFFRENEENYYNEVNSVYIISDIFTLICFDYIDGYLESKYQIYLESKNNFKKEFTMSDFIWVFLYIISISIGAYGIFVSEYVCFFLSFNITLKFTNFFAYIFNPNLSRILNHFILLLFILLEYQISNKGDDFLTNILLYFQFPKSVIIVILKIIGLSIFIYYIFYMLYTYYCRSFIENSENKNEDNNNENSNEDSENEEEENNEYSEEEEEIIETYIYSKKKLIFCLVLELFLCYIDLLLFSILIINDYTNSLNCIIYGMIIIFLFSRKFSLLKEVFQIDNFNNYYYLIIIVLDMRLILFTEIYKNSALNLFYILNFAIVIYVYFLTAIQNKNYIMSIINFCHICLAYTFFSSIIILSTILFSISTPILSLFDSKKNSKKREKKEEKDEGNFSLIFLLIVIIGFSVQQIGALNIMEFFQNILINLKNLVIEYNLMTLFSEDSRNGNGRKEPKEFRYLIEIINWVRNI